MIKNQKDRMMRQAPSEKDLICVSDCNLPGIGTFIKGERVNDPVALAYIAAHPGEHPHFVTKSKEAE